MKLMSYSFGVDIIYSILIMLSVLIKKKDNSVEPYYQKSKHE